ncbi:MAG: glycosyltransferase [Clostridiales bacterium]|nr:glycosyltransferase [Clostridiales bacterium]
MNIEPKLSVIMGVHNTEDKVILDKAILSILNQTYSDFEFIICDDGSTDATCQYIKEYEKKDKRIVVISNPVNVGLAKTLNNCIDIARGQYIARMDADDISKINRFEEQIGFLECHSEYAFVGCCAELINENGIWGKRTHPEQPGVKAFLWGSPFIHPSIVFRKEVLVQMGGYRVSKETRRLEDLDLFMRLYKAGYRGYNLPSTFFQFREDDRSYARKKYRYRIDEAKIRFRFYREMKMLRVGIFFAMKPLVVGLIPVRLIKLLRQENV